jgi:hypothetical protein
MKLFDYLECKYVEKNLENQAAFSLFTQAETHACQNLINFMRRVFRISCYPKILVEYILVCLKLKAPPISIKDRADAAKAKATVVSETQG